MKISKLVHISISHEEMQKSQFQASPQSPETEDTEAETSDV